MITDEKIKAAHERATAELRRAQSIELAAAELAQLAAIAERPPAWCRLSLAHGTAEVEALADGNTVRITLTRVPDEGPPAEPDRPPTDQATTLRRNVRALGGRPGALTAMEREP